MPGEILILTSKDLAAILSFRDYFASVESAFRKYAEGKVIKPGILDLPGQGGVFHVKAAGMQLEDRLFAAFKVNGNFPGNLERNRLPTIQGGILLCDATNGSPLCFLDSTEITAWRTAAATAVAAKYLARPDSHTVTICGCGKQGRAQLAALRQVLPIRKAFAWDKNVEAARAFVSELSGESALDLGAATLQSDLIVACTTSRAFYLSPEHVKPGTFIAAVGADSHDKQELSPELLLTNTVVTDITSQCLSIGDLHHATSDASVVHAELGQIVAGQKPGRTSQEEIIIFDSTGSAIQDVAAASCAYIRALQMGVGMRISL